MGKAAFLFCSRCDRQFASSEILNLCPCGGPILVSYDLDEVKRHWRPEHLATGPTNMWRYHPVLPASREKAISLGEGWTPLLPAKRLGSAVGAEALWIKDEANNPTGSFKARGQSCAVTMASQFGLTDLAIPSAGNAGGALAAYAAAAGLRAHIFLPADVPQANFLECKAHGADLKLVDGLISDCARLVAQQKERNSWFEVSTLKEPYRIEGKKTMGYELAEQFRWELPDAVVYPCGGGVGLIGIWKAFGELEKLGWISSPRPKMIAVQAEGCRPIVDAYESGQTESQAAIDAQTVAAGLRVPKAIGDFLVLRAIRESAGTAVAVSDTEMLDDGILMAQTEGIFPAPEGGACVTAVRKLLASGFLKPEERIVILNTGAGAKYSEAYATRFPRRLSSEQDKLGGLITPR
jgi:threonine synthase